ncbi:hypothetical protein Q8A67_025828 [Cirrhinus molitorella]|uniref:Uncharacterized protein n=1 Tax=Cirrhinus molitorella TaxID=172907 RepID=A0AA88P0C2_9TELE|nr:hypothetical protein Q8A67_025828 [Cirrhinus molitorella]
MTGTLNPERGVVLVTLRRRDLRAIIGFLEFSRAPSSVRANRAESANKSVGERLGKAGRDSVCLACRLR